MSFFSSSSSFFQILKFKRYHSVLPFWIFCSLPWLYCVNCVHVRLLEHDWREGELCLSKNILLVDEVHQSIWMFWMVFTWNFLTVILKNVNFQRKSNLKWGQTCQILGMNWEEATAKAICNQDDNHLEKRGSFLGFPFWGGGRRGQ